MSDIAIQISTIDQKKRFTVTNIERIEEDITRLSSEIASLRSKLASADSDISNKQEEIDVKTKLIEELKNQLKKEMPLLLNINLSSRNVKSYLMK